MVLKKFRYCYFLLIIFTFSCTNNKEEIEVVMAQIGLKDLSKISGDVLYNDISGTLQMEIDTANRVEHTRSIINAKS